MWLANGDRGQNAPKHVEQLVRRPSLNSSFHYVRAHPSDLSEDTTCFYLLQELLTLNIKHFGHLINWETFKFEIFRSPKYLNAERVLTNETSYRKSSIKPLL